MTFINREAEMAFPEWSVHPVGVDILRALEGLPAAVFPGPNVAAGAIG